MIATVGFCWLMTLLGIGPRILISRYFYHNSTARHANWTDILCSLNGPERFRHWDLTAPHLPSLKASIQHDPENLSWAAGQNGTNCANIWNGREIFPVRHAHPHGHCCTHPAAPQGLLSWEAGREKPGNSQEKTVHQPRTTAPTPRRVPSSRTEFRVALSQQFCQVQYRLWQVLHGRGQAHLTAAKRTLMLDSDRPLTIRSIMFSVSMIWAKELRSVHNSTAFMACWGFGYRILNVTEKNCS